MVRPRHNDVQLNVRCSSSPSLGVGFGAGFRQGLPFTSAWCGSRLTKSAQCSGYCAVLVVEMLGLTAYRRNPKRCCWLALNRPGQSQRAPTRTAQFGCRMVADFAERRLGRDPRLQIRDSGKARQLILVRLSLHMAARDASAVAILARSTRGCGRHYRDSRGERLVPATSRSTPSVTQPRVADLRRHENE